MLLKINVVFLFIFIFTSLTAQDAEETIFFSEDGTYHPTELIETLSSLKKSPLNINTASREELTELPWLSELDIGNIIKSRKIKPISGWKELQNIGINEITISEIKDYIIFRDKPGFKLNQRLRGEYSEYNDNIESTLKYYQRTLFQYDKFSFGFLSQKDEGEKDPFDFYSYFIEYKSNSFLKQSVLGKYRLAAGQGIIFAPKLGMSKSSAATSVAVKKYKAIKPYTSSYEIWELEGAAANINLGNFAFIPFYSSGSYVFPVHVFYAKYYLVFRDSFHFLEVGIIRGILVPICFFMYDFVFIGVDSGSIFLFDSGVSLLCVSHVPYINTVWDICYQPIKILIGIGR